MKYIVHLLIGVITSLHLLQPILAASIQTTLFEAIQNNPSRRASDDWMPGKCRDEHYMYDETWEEELEHRQRHFRDCREYWIISPTPAPFVVTFPTATPTRSPTRRPTASPTKRPTPLPTAEPSRAPTNLPTPSPTKGPSPSPTTSAGPTLIEFFEVRLPEFELSLTFGNNARRKLLEISDILIFDVLDLILSEAYKKKFPDFHVLDLTLGEKSQQVNGDSSVITYPFGGGCVFTSDDPTGIPDESTLTEATMRAFLEEGVTKLLKDASDSSFSSLSVKRVGSTQVVSNQDTDVITDNVSRPDGTITLTIVASIVAVVSTLTALGLIFYQRRNTEEVVETTPTFSPTRQQNSPKGLRKIMSPFPLTATPADGTRKYFSRLDDGSISSKSQNNGYLNPNISIVNSSFSKDEESSLEAPSMAGLSSICDFSKAGDSLKSLEGGENVVCDLSKEGDSLKSLDGESYANMSALDEVRLGRVLDLEGSITDENSLATVSESGSKLERKYRFAKLWNGNKNKENTPLMEGSSDTVVCTKLAPPSNDSPMKNSPIPMKPSTSVDVEQHQDIESVIETNGDVGEDSLLGIQTENGLFYNENDEPQSIFNVLGGRSVNSIETESVDFNDMYAAESSSFDESSTGESSKLSSDM